jgi:hypothetical protein
MGFDNCFCSKPTFVLKLKHRKTVIKKDIRRDNSIRRSVASDVLDAEMTCLTFGYKIANTVEKYNKYMKIT